MKWLLFITTLIVFCTNIWAGPAAWFKWHSPEADYEVCAQFSPGDGWVIVKGPFGDSGCRKSMQR